MKFSRFSRHPFRGVLLMASALAAAAPLGASACSVCYGEPESPASIGLSWAITAMVVIVVSVLSGAVAFFVHANRKAAVLQAAESATAIVEKD
jgi:hypothetical protein